MTPLFKINLEVNKNWSQKNNNRIRFTGKRFFLGKQEALIRDRDYLVLALKNAWKNKPTINGPIHAKFTFGFANYYTAKGKMNLKLGDLSNLVQLPEDCLQKAGIIADDALIMSLDGTRKTPSVKNELTIEIFPFIS